MKALLTSSEFRGYGILEQVEKLAGKSADKISVGIIIEAVATEKGDKRWLIDGLSEVSSAFGGEIDIINLLALNKDEVLRRVEAVDVIFCFGGSSEWLKIVFEKSGFSQELPKLLEDKVWIGSSAGGMILGKMSDEKLQSYVYQVEDFFGVKSYLDYLDFEIIPHIWGKFVPSDSFEKCLEWSKSNKNVMYILSDNSAVCVDGEKVWLVGEKACKILNGKILEEI